MTVSDRGLQLIADAEGYRGKPYLCPAGVPTIGYGCTYYTDGRRVTLKDPPISKPDAWALLAHVAGTTAAEIERRSRVALSQGQLDALTSFAFNFGTPKLFASTLWRKLQEGNVIGAAAQFPLWRTGINKATGRREVMPGLVTRRAAERKVFVG